MAGGWAFFVSFLGFVVALNGIGRRGQKTWDKVFLAVAGLGVFAWLALTAVDAARFRWSAVPLWLRGFGVTLLLGSFHLFYLTFSENTFLSPAIRVQTERAQTVVSTGPYRYVRHPMYAAFVLLTLGTPLFLGSWYRLLGGLLLIGMVARRAVVEERVLREGLQGYGAYMARVRCRLVPYLW